MGYDEFGYDIQKKYAFQTQSFYFFSLITFPPSFIEEVTEYISLYYTSSQISSQ